MGNNHFLGQSTKPSINGSFLHDHVPNDRLSPGYPRATCLHGVPPPVATRPEATDFPKAMR